MRLLIITQVVDSAHPVLGFFHRWIEEFAKRSESVSVICLQKGTHTMPKNVQVYSLGKEEGVSKSAYVWHFYKHLWQRRKEYDAVFVHMNVEYLLLAGLLWRLMGKRVGLWYVHKSVHWMLRVAVGLSDVVFTASKESFRLPSSKVKVVGHGIDVETFSAHKKSVTNPFTFVTVGRVSSTKRIAEMITSVQDFSRNNAQGAHLNVVGAPATKEDSVYMHRLEKEARAWPGAPLVSFLGPKEHKDIPEVVSSHMASLNFSTTGSLDKAVLESLAVGVPVITTNEAFRDASWPVIFLAQEDTQAFAEAVISAEAVDSEKLIAYVREHHSLHRLVQKIVELYRVR